MNVPPENPTRPEQRAYASEQLGKLMKAVRSLSDPAQLGPYHILQPIGEGGMGAVYKAEQRTPIQRVVAVKVIKVGMDTREVIARFEAERQALAVMDHPNVARVIDAGATEDGRPYFVMEYVQGEPITSFSDRHLLTVEQRLELFRQACEGVQHAHQKAIIHRDLKPSNILVAEHEGKPWVKVIDFGVAKAIDHRLTEKTVFTESGQFIGTLEYMSPEQADARGEDVDTRTDVYALGVVLYELLTGAVPFDAARLRTAGYQEIQRIIRDVDPPRPSTRLSGLGELGSQVAACRRIALDALETQLHRELDWIPLKAMRKVASERYATATELSEDIANYLAHRPLRAGPETAGYRTRKFLRRNRRSVAAAAGMVVLLLGGIVATTTQAVRATRAERRATSANRETQVAYQNAQAVNRFLTEDLLASAAPAVTRGREMSVREAVDRAADSVARRFKDQPLTEASVHSVLAQTYGSLGERERSLPHAQAALEIYGRECGPDHEQTILAMCNVGRDLAELNRHGEAEPMLRHALDRSRRLRGDDHPVTLTCVRGLAMTLRMQRRLSEAEPLLRQALDGARRVYGPQSAEVAQTLNGLAVLLNSQRRADEAEVLYRQAIEIQAKLLGKDDPAYLSSVSNLARVIADQGKLKEAEELERWVLGEKRRVLKDDHPSTLLSLNNLGVVLEAGEKYQEAEILHREAFTRRLRVLGEDNIDTLQSMSNLGNVLALLGRYPEAEELLRRAADKRAQVLGPTHTQTLNTMLALARIYEGQDRFVDAEAILRKVCEAESFSALPAPHQALVQSRFGCCLARAGELAKAETVLVEAHRRLRETNQSDGEHMRRVLTALAKLCDEGHRPEEAVKWRAEFTAVTTATRPNTQPATRPTPFR